MKKLIALCLVLILAAPALTTNAESSLQKELNKELVKQLKKNYKKRKRIGEGQMENLRFFKNS